MTEQSVPEVGQAVKLVTEDYSETAALVTAVHGVGWTNADGEYFPPSINCVYVSLDPAKRDPYGIQLERYSSLQHVSGTKGMPRPGRYWDYQ
jgi:hypothetical protein